MAPETGDATEPTDDSAKPALEKMDTDPIGSDATEKVEVKELSDKDKKRFERLYKMNDAPSIPVHTNKTVKNGKFECQLVSLHTLLEYRSDDQKENTFEVSVFAEQFNEMIQRDSAFKIYKTLARLPSSLEQTEKVDGEPEAKRKREEVAAEAKPVATEAAPAGTAAMAAAVAKVPLDLDTLMAFCTFDADHADYVKEHDLEEILHSVGLDLSRSQARKLIAKAVCRRGGVYYRELSGAAAVAGDDCISDIELSKGNKSRLAEIDDAAGAALSSSTIYTDNKESTLAKIAAIERVIKEIRDNFNAYKAELGTIDYC